MSSRADSTSIGSGDYTSAYRIVAASSYPDRRWISHWCRAGDDIVRKLTGTRIQKTSRKQRLPYRPAERS